MMPVPRQGAEITILVVGKKPDDVAAFLYLAPRNHASSPMG
jgi:hypothetical protein